MRCNELRHDDKAGYPPPARPLKVNDVHTIFSICCATFREWAYILCCRPQSKTCRTKIKNPLTMGDCCLKGFKWDGIPQGEETTLAGNKCYISGSNQDAAILVIHDLFGWTFQNVRLLADHYAQEVNATVFVPDL